VKAQCLPFSQIPHTTRLFADFLAGAPAVQPFFPRTPDFPSWLQDETSKVRYDSARRERVAAILGRQNQSWGASPETLKNIARLRACASAVVTGQQVGFLGGPLFSIFKALTAVKLAAEATKAGSDCVPIFWLATQDHDLEEVSHVQIPGPEASLQRLEASTSGLPGAPVGVVTLGPDNDAVMASATQLLGESDVTAFLRESYRSGETLGNAFARLFAKLFADWGVILLDASDPELNAVAAPIYRAAIERASQLDELLLARGRELEAAGYHQQVKVTPSSTLLFTLRDGARVPVHRVSESSDFSIGDQRIAQADLLQLISSAPHHFSANVLLRPVVQDYLLPTLAYTGGSAEVAYFAQSAVIYEALLQRITPIVPRFSATIVEAKPQALLERFSLALPDLFRGPEAVREQLAAHALPKELQSGFDAAEAGIKKSFTAIRDALLRLDKTLVDAAETAESKMHYQLEGLRSKAARAELRQSEVLDRKAQLLSHALYPEKTLQEREIAGVYFLARYGPALLRDLYQTIHCDCFDHQLISL
jgi:bacillithiol synthase